MKIIEAGDLPAEKKVYLKKSLDGYRVVYPIKNEDGSYNYVNLLFGGYGNLIKVLFYIFLALMIFLGTNELISSYKTIADNPCNFCKDCQAALRPDGSMNFNLSLGVIPSETKKEV